MGVAFCSHAQQIPETLSGRKIQTAAARARTPAPTLAALERRRLHPRTWKQRKVLCYTPAPL